MKEVPTKESPVMLSAGSKVNGGESSIDEPFQVRYVDLGEVIVDHGRSVHSNHWPSVDDGQSQPERET